MVTSQRQQFRKVGYVGTFCLGRSIFLLVEHCGARGPVGRRLHETTLLPWSPTPPF